MLILTRKISQQIVIGDDIIITIMGLSGMQVRIGVDAPKALSVHRREIYDKIQEEKNKNSDIEEKDKEDLEID